MKILIFGDLHANFAALKEVFTFYKEVKPDRVYFLGDLVGYGTEPKECLDFTLEWKNINLIQGNHDRAVAGDFIGLDRYSSFAFNSLLWTQEVLEDYYKKILNSLPLTLTYEDMGFVHSSFLNPKKFSYIKTNIRAWYELFRTKQKIIFTGHTHKVKIWEKYGYKIKFLGKIQPESKIFLNKKNKYLVQCGSSGFQIGFSDVFVFDVKEYSLQFFKLRYKAKRNKNINFNIEVPTLI